MLFVLLSLAPAVAAAGELEGEIGLDGLHATSSAAGDGVGAPERLTATELGMRLRARLHEVDDRLRIEIDYRGREPIAGSVRNATHRLLYAADATFEAVPDRWSIGAGRFVPPSVVLLPVDGVHSTLTLDPSWEVSVFGGRRAITTSRRNVPLGRFLPAGGAAVRWTGASGYAEALAAWAQDEILVSPASDDPAFRETLGGAHGAVHASLWPADDWRVGGRLVVAQQASYVLGPTWAGAEIAVEAADLWSGLAWAQWEPRGDLELAYDLHGQRAGVFRAGWRTGEGDLDPALVEPGFVDNRVRAGWRPGDLGWLRTDLRWRARPERHELRYGVSADADALPVPGLTARGGVFLDSLVGDPAFARPVDRLFWRAAVGYRDASLDVEVGASFVERAANPVSGRLDHPVDPTRTGDLSPFVLEAQDIAFVRAFYTARRWYGGVDLEHGFAPGEFRVMLQAGVLEELRW